MLPLDVAAELQLVTPLDPREVVADLVHLIEAVDERLLRIAEVEEPGDADERQPLRRRVGIRHVDPVVLIAQAARHRRIRRDAVRREARHVDRVVAEHVRVRQHEILQRCFRFLRRRRDGDAVRRRLDAIGCRAEIAHQQRVGARDLVVAAEADRVAIVGRRRRHDVAGRAAVRGRHEVVDQLERRRIEAAGRNDVAVERLAGERIADRRAAREIAAPLRIRQHDDVRRIALLIAVALVVPEQEQLVLLKRTAGRAAELILFQRGLRLARRREEVPRLQRIVAVELPRRPVQLVASRFRDDVDDGAGVAAELGGVRVRLDLEFLDGVWRRTQHEPGVERVVVGRAVEQEAVGLVAHAVDAVARRGRAESARRRVAGLTAETCRWRDHARNECAELREVPAVERQLDHFLLVDGDAERGVRRLDERRLPRHRHALLESPDRHLHVDARRVADRHRDVRAHDRLESAERRLHRIAARLHLRDGIEAVGAGDRRSRLPRRRIGDVDRHARHDGAALVGDDARDCAGCLRGGERWREKSAEKQQGALDHGSPPWSTNRIDHNLPSSVHCE